MVPPVEPPLVHNARPRSAWALWMVGGFVGGWAALRVVQYANGFFLTPSLRLVLALWVIGAVMTAGGVLAQRRFLMPGSVWIAALGAPIGWAAYCLLIVRDDLWGTIIESVTTLVLLSAVGLSVRWLASKHTLTKSQ